jgi:hypothetical protein
MDVMRTGSCTVPPCIHHFCYCPTPCAPPPCSTPAAAAILRVSIFHRPRLLTNARFGFPVHPAGAELPLRRTDRSIHTWGEGTGAASRSCRMGIRLCWDYGGPTVSSLHRGGEGPTSAPLALPDGPVPSKIWRISRDVGAANLVLVRGEPRVRDQVPGSDDCR